MSCCDGRESHSYRETRAVGGCRSTRLLCVDPGRQWETAVVCVVTNNIVDTHTHVYIYNCFNGHFPGFPGFFCGHLKVSKVTVGECGAVLHSDPNNSISALTTTLATAVALQQEQRRMLLKFVVQLTGWMVDGLYPKPNGLTLPQLESLFAAKMILTAPPPDNWKRPPRHPRITWLNTSEIWEPTTWHWTKESTWLRTVLCGGWCLRMVLRTPSGAWLKRRRRRSVNPIPGKHG